MNAAKLAKLLRRKQRIEERIDTLKADLEEANRPDARATIVAEVMKLTDDYGRVERKLARLEGWQF